MLVHTSDQDPGYARKGAGKGFYYLDEEGEKVSDRSVIERIHSLAIPPAYDDVWICPIENGHLQATGYDSRKRKQYRYHPKWHELQALEKFDRLITVGAGLPRLRRRLRSDLKGEHDAKEFVVATAVKLIDKLGFRVGNDAYLKKNQTRGISTLSVENIDLSEPGNEVGLYFTAKGGREVETSFSDPLLREALENCHDLPGQRLFTYTGRNGDPVAIGSADINDLLHEVFDDDITAKSLRTWRASTATVEFLRKIKTPGDRESEIRDAVQYAADEIQNKYTTCRKHYVHPKILECYEASGKWGISRMKPKPVAELQQSEAVLVSILGG